MKWDVRGGRAPTFGPLPTLTCEFYLANGKAEEIASGKRPGPAGSSRLQPAIRH